jgi:hypothetical protein
MVRLGRSRSWDAAARLFLLGAFLAGTLHCVTATRSSHPPASAQLTGQGRPRGRSGENPFIALTKRSEDPTYGYSEENPIRVGGVEQDGAARERDFLRGLLGPGGEEIEFERMGSCCEFKTPNSPFGAGLLDVYAVTYEGLKEPVVLVFDIYDEGDLKVPMGFTPLE